MRDIGDETLVIRAFNETAVAHLDGRSALSTQSGHERFPVMTMRYALLEMVEKTHERSNKVRIITNSTRAKMSQQSDKAKLITTAE